MMKKFLFVAAAVVASMVFTGCINEDDTYKKLQPVQQGINIYNWTSSQYSMATEQANIGMRMAMLVAEAHKQGVDNFEDVKIEGISIKGKLLGTSSKIEKTTTGYKITFNPAYMDMDGYSREGAVLIDTAGPAARRCRARKGLVGDVRRKTGAGCHQRQYVGKGFAGGRFHAALQR